MPDELNLTLPKREGEPRKASWPATVLLLLVVAIGAANLIVALRGSGSGEGRVPSAAGLAPEEQKELALKLERRGLHDAAVHAWQTYLSSTWLDGKQRANVWYRIGKIHQDAGQYEKALAGFYTSESLAFSDELAPEIGRRTRECLEALGKFAALRHELTDRVEIGESKAPAGEEVVAEIGQQKITRARLDQMIEEQIDRQLAQFAAFVPDQERKRQKEAMVQRFGTAEARLQMLEQLVAEEVLYRKAREDKLAEDAETRALLADVERKLLAQRVVEKELADQVKIAPGDLQDYYEAHKKEYVQPERAEISHILVKDDETAKAARKSLDEGMRFGDLAQKLSTDDATKEKGGEIPGWVEKGSYIPGIGSSDDATAAIFSTEPGKVAGKTVKSDRGVHIIKIRSREPERQKTFDEVRDQVYQALRTRKTREVQQKLIDSLRERYDVVVHRAKFEAQEPEPKKGKAPAPKQGEKQDDAKKAQ